MKNIVGQTPRGENFYPRTPVIDKIYRRLDSSNHLYLSAPRRSGKTSIMRAMEDNPKAGYIFIYLDVEDCTNAEDYFRVLAEKLEESLTKHNHLAKLSDKAKGVFKKFLENVKSIKIAGLELETSGLRHQTTYAEAFELLLQELEVESTIIVLMVDEFPVAVENIAKAESREAAARFLHANRALRQRAQNTIRFIYTGSIGLPNVARQIDANPTVNDLNIIEIPPLNEQEGLDMSLKIFENYGIVVEEEVIRYMLGKIEWLMPFFIQLVIQLLIDESEATESPISKSMVDAVLQKAANHRNNVYFASYYDRLSKNLPKEQCETAHAMLLEIANKGSAKRSNFTQENANVVLETLEYDGYIHQQKEVFRFNSPILRMWWKKNA